MPSAYSLIATRYANTRTNRSGVPLINHIHEGVAILTELRATPAEIDAYCLHPLFQADYDLNMNQSLVVDAGLDAWTILLAMEYRNIANAYLSTRHIDHPDDIDLSPIPAVNRMLFADKVQNFKDFMQYHRKTHDRSDELFTYFMNWHVRLGITNVFAEVTRDPTVLPMTEIRKCGVWYGAFITQPTNISPRRPHPVQTANERI